MSNDNEKTLLLDSEKSDLIPDHNYDGILELSRPMPFWLSLIFFCTVTFGLIYMLHKMSGADMNQADTLAAEMKQIKALQERAQLKPSDSKTESENNTDPIKMGQAVYASKCSVCHQPNGEGSIGPNLTDNYWIHGQGTLVDIETVIKKGVDGKGMPPWEQALSVAELKAVVAFVHSLSGTNVPNGKAPQGELIKK